MKRRRGTRQIDIVENWYQIKTLQRQRQYLVAYALIVTDQTIAVFSHTTCFSPQPCFTRNLASYCLHFNIIGIVPSVPLTLNVWGSHQLHCQLEEQKPRGFSYNCSSYGETWEIYAEINLNCGCSSVDRVRRDLLVLMLNARIAWIVARLLRWWQ